MGFRDLRAAVPLGYQFEHTEALGTELELFIYGYELGRTDASAIRQTTEINVIR
jgi:hypothetical protein